MELLSKMGDRRYYSDNFYNENYVGMAKAYFSECGNSLSYCIDENIIEYDEAFREVLSLIDSLKLDFNGLPVDSRRRIYSKESVITEYGYLYISKSYKYFLKYIPVVTEVNFKIYVYRR